LLKQPPEKNEALSEPAILS